MLFKKAVRAILSNKKAYAACILLIAVGVLIYVSMGVATNSLESARDNYFEEYALADIFAKVKLIPVSDAEILQNIEGIDEVMGRLTYDARVVMEDNKEIINLRLISHNNSPTQTLNKHYLVEGTEISSPDDILIGEAFVNAHNLKVGDKIKLIIQGKEYTFNICGKVQSPEYVYAIKDSKQLMPSPETFSFAYVSENALANSMNMQGLYNDLSFKLQDGYIFDDVKIAIEENLKKYGLSGLIPKKDQLSYSMLKTEIEGNRAFSTSIPFVFVIMSVVVLYLMLKRVIEQDRMQIGTLKAFGYSNIKILNHYMLYGIITGLAGGLAGDLLGLPLTSSFIELYAQYYQIPNLKASNTTIFLVIGILIGVFGGAVGAFMGAYKILGLLPAEAMRPIAPKAIKNDILKKLPLIKSLLTSIGSMAVRSIERNKVRSFFIILSIMFSFGIIAFMDSFSNMIDVMLYEQYTKIEVYEAKVVLQDFTDYNKAVKNVRDIKGVTRAEGILEIPVTLSKKHRKEGVIITGLTEDTTLYKIYDTGKKTNFSPPKNGVIINNALARKLEVSRGDEIYISSALLDEDVKVLVWDIVEQNLGSSCYMEINTLENIFDIGHMTTTILFNTDDMEYAKDYLIDGKNVAIIESSAGTLKAMEEMLGSTGYIIWVMEIMSGVVAFAIIYNTSTISLSERKREYATLRVLGLQVKEVGEILSFEYWILCFGGVILGIPFTIFLKQSVSSIMDIEMFTIPTNTPIQAYFVGLAGCILAVLFSNKTAIRNIKKFDMVEVLKERE